jgi:hypothetical protein
MISRLKKCWKLWRLASQVDAINWEMEVHLSNVIRVVWGWSKLSESDKERATLIMMRSWSREKINLKWKLLRQMVLVRGGN